MRHNNAYKLDENDPFWNDINTTITITNPNDVVIDTTPVIPFNSTENATIIFLSPNDIPGVPDGTYHLYQDGWNKDNNNLHLDPPSEASILFLQSVELDTSTNNDTTDYKATNATFPIQLSSDQITALKVANGTESDNNLILTNMHMNLESVSDTSDESSSNPTYSTENLSAEYNIYYGENINYDDIINYYSLLIDSIFIILVKDLIFLLENISQYGVGENLYFGGIAGDHNPPYMERQIIENSIDLYGYEIYDSVFLGNLRYASFSDESGLQDQLVFSFTGRTRRSYYLIMEIVLCKMV